MTERPTLSSQMTGTEFRRWYWLKDELAEFARSLGLRTSGRKEILASRIGAFLDGETFTEPSTKRGGAKNQLGADLLPGTVIPRGQRCSQNIRAWFIEQVGPTFGFDAQMRAFFANTDGTQTMQDALDHYLATRNQGTQPIDSQFEYNRFTRAWHEQHPVGSQEELLEAWRIYRNTPIDERGRI